MKLEARNISFQYGPGGFFIFQDYDFVMERGEVVGLVSPSGYGKSTLCKLLGGYEKPLSGEILLDERPLEQFRGYCPVQMVWQHANMAVDARMRMKDILSEGGCQKEEILEELGIRREWMTRFPGELSGGELQRFCIARALGEDTRFLLADEITAMLDMVSQCQIWKFLLKRVQQQNIGILAVSHSRELLEQICTRIIEL